MPEGSAAECQASPQGNGICGVCRDRWNSGKQKRGEGDETSAAGDSIEGAAESCRSKK